MKYSNQVKVRSRLTDVAVIVLFTTTFSFSLVNLLISSSYLLAHQVQHVSVQEQRAVIQLHDS